MLCVRVRMLRCLLCLLVAWLSVCWLSSIVFRVVVVLVLRLLRCLIRVVTLLGFCSCRMMMRCLL